MTSLSYGRIFFLESKKNRRYVSTIQSFFFYLNFTFLLKISLQFTQNLNRYLKKEQCYGAKQLFLFEMSLTRLCRPTGYGDYLWAGRPMFSAVGLFLGLKSKILHEQNVIYFHFYIRLPNLRLLGLII